MSRKVFIVLDGDRSHKICWNTLLLRTPHFVWSRTRRSNRYDDITLDLLVLRSRSDMTMTVCGSYLVCDYSKP
jgi:hypothetical protein